MRRGNVFLKRATVEFFSKENFFLRDATFLMVAASFFVKPLGEERKLLFSAAAFNIECFDISQNSCLALTSTIPISTPADMLFPERDKWKRFSLFFFISRYSGKSWRTKERFFDVLKNERGVAHARFIIPEF
jgi:hypothetical protein